MKTYLRINELALRRGLVTAYRLQRAADLSPSNAVKLFNDRSTMLSLATIDKLCEVLSCTPGELFSVRTGRKRTQAEPCR